MVSKKIWIGLNFLLIVMAIFLLLTFFGVKMPSVGKAFYVLDSNLPYCLTSYQNKQSLIDPDFCCSQLQQQLIKAEPFRQTFFINGQEIKIDKKYYTSESTLSYFINKKAYYYCKTNGFKV